MIEPRKHNGTEHHYYNPRTELNAGLWTLWTGATIFLALRLWIKISKRHGLWYDDYILLVAWVILTVNDSLISLEYATGYVADKWDDRMQILINITSDGTVLAQAITKTAFAVTLLKLTKGWQRWVLWFCIVTMNAWASVRCVFQWARIYEKPSYEVWYRLHFHLHAQFRDDFKEGGNVYNILMDFFFASVPWYITWGLDMRKAEKIGLCVTMSLGMIVAIVAAIRVGWKDDGNIKDEWYFWRLAHSNIWYSSEPVGTIIVQCIPVLRPLLRDLHTSLTSHKIPSFEYEGNTNASRRSKWVSGYQGNPNHVLHSPALGNNGTYNVGVWADGDGKSMGKRGDRIELDPINDDERSLSNHFDEYFKEGSKTEESSLNSPKRFEHV